MEIKELLQKYYDSLGQKDDKWQELYADDAFFSDASKILHATGKDAVIQSFTAFLAGVEEVKVKEIIIEGDSACAIVGYDYINPKGIKWSQDVAEIWKIKDGKLAQLILYFDIIAYRNYMRS